MKLPAALLATMAIALASCARGAASDPNADSAAQAGAAPVADAIPVADGDPRIALAAIGARDRLSLIFSPSTSSSACGVR